MANYKKNLAGDVRASKKCGDMTVLEDHGDTLLIMFLDTGTRVEVT